MIRFAWIQSRTQNLVAIAGLVGLAVALAITGPHLVHLYYTLVAGCQARGNCPTATEVFLRHDSALRGWLGILVVVVPAVGGIFWGAPLVARELETGTFRLAWTQGVTRTRWLAVKLGVVGLASTALAGLLALMVTWWASPLDRARMDAWSVFDQRDVVPVGYAAAAFVLGVTAGILVRRALPAMATTLVAFGGTRLAVSHWLRPHLLSPARLSVALDPNSMGFGSDGSGPPNLVPNPPDMANAWIYSDRIVDHAGHALTPQVVAAACPALDNPSLGGPPPGPLPGPGHVFTLKVPGAVQSAMHDCVSTIGTRYHGLVTYQPASRYWAFQWYELAIYLGLAVALAGGCLWWVRRRLS
ncbi:MAG: hypothetical protein ACRDY0_04345 [Acidimicrobiales bacterium]